MPDLFPRILALAAALSLSVGSAAATGGNAHPSPLGASGNWTQIFADEFDAAGPDPARWTTCYWWDDDGCTNLGNEELQWYMPANVAVRDGELILTARRENVSGYKGRPFGYTSGMVTSGRYYEESPSATRFATTYGFFEIRAKVPSGQGLWPAFWLLPTTHESKPEIDVMEVLGHRPGVLEMHLHYRDKDGETHSVGHETENVDLSAGWHVYGLRWSKDAVVWYLDGVEQWRYAEEEGISQEPMYMLLNLAVGGNWPGSPDESTRFPAEFRIDYVRVWQEAGR